MAASIDLALSKACENCGDPFLAEKKTRHFCSRSCSSNLGYCIENVVSCCSPCNKAKGTLSQKEFIAWLDRLVKYRLKGDSNGC